VLPVAIFVCFGWLISVCLHEFGHAIVAYWGGDTSVKDKGYLTLNPLKYTDLNLSLTLPLLFLLMGGIALPGAAVYIDHRRLRNRWWESAVSAAGPFASILVTLLLTIPFQLGLATTESWVWSALAFLIVLDISVVIINLLPIPPLDGYGIIEPWLPSQTKIHLRNASKYGVIVLFLLLWYVKPLSQAVWNATFSICTMLGVPVELAFQGQQSFTTSSGIVLLAAVGIGLLVRRLINPANFWYEKGNGLFRTKKYGEAIASYDKALKLKPNLAEAWDYRGRSFASLGQYEEAIASYDKSLQLNADSSVIWTNRGIALSCLQRHQEALNSCNKAIEINPNSPYAWYTKACYYAEQEQLNLAIENLEQAINLEPDTFTKFAVNDPCFDLIRDTTPFQKLINKSQN
jgi:tetratricopeptide (TPR) repeat protein